MPCKRLEKTHSGRRWCGASLMATDKTKQLSPLYVMRPQRYRWPSSIMSLDILICFLCKSVSEHFISVSEFSSLDHYSRIKYFYSESKTISLSEFFYNPDEFRRLNAPKMEAKPGETSCVRACGAQTAFDSVNETATATALNQNKQRKQQFRQASNTSAPPTKASRFDEPSMVALMYVESIPKSSY